MTARKPATTWDQYPLDRRRCIEGCGTVLVQIRRHQSSRMLQRCASCAARGWWRERSARVRERLDEVLRKVV